MSLRSNPSQSGATLYAAANGSSVGYGGTMNATAPTNGDVAVCVLNVKCDSQNTGCGAIVLDATSTLVIAAQ